MPEFPDFVAAIANEKSVLYQNGFGFADIEKQILSTIKPLNRSARLVKIFIGVVLIKAVDEENLSLETNINDWNAHKEFADAAATKTFK